MITAGVSLTMVSSEMLVRTVLSNSAIMIGAIIVEFALVMALSAAMPRLSSATALLGFFAYAALNGITFSTIFLVYTGQSIGQVFLISAGMFGGLALFGTATKRDLSAMGTFFMMGLFGMILVGLVNLFMQSAALSFGISLIGVIVFSGLTAYDAQRIKSMAYQYSGGQTGSEMEKKGAVFGALSLYLNFVNLFLSLLRLFGRRQS